MDKSDFIRRVAAAESPERKAAKLPEFQDSDTVSKPQISGGAKAAFIRNFTSNHGDVIESEESLVEFLKAKGCSKGVIDAKLQGGTFGLEKYFDISREFDRNNPDAYDFGISAASFAIGENGAIVLKDSDIADRMCSIAPWVHVAVLRESDIVETIPEALKRTVDSPYAIWITGPSKTTDVEGILVEGVHGPGIQAAFIVK